jgi:ATP-dependent Clp endopeptidase proteolytic subunit ClpP
MPHQSRLPFEMKAPQRGPQEWFRFENKANTDTTDIYIFGRIGDSFWDDSATSAQSFVDEMKKVKTDKISVHLNSPGGEIFDGLAIYNTLKQSDKEVTVKIDALAASAASFIAMAADPGKLLVARNAVMMIHDGSGIAFGNAATMREMADTLDMLSDNIADIYSQRAGGSVEYWREAMKMETWYTGAEAKNANLADATFEDADESAEKAAASFDLSVYNYAGREQAPSPSVIHNRIKSMMNSAKEATVAGPTPKAHVEATPASGEPVVEQEVEETGEEVEETPAAGANGDGQPVPGTQPAPVQNNTAQFAVMINGERVTDAVRIQAYINSMEAAQTEARNTARRDFVENLCNTNRLPATQLDATVEFAQELSDKQYESWTAQWTNAASLPLLAQHGGGSITQHGAQQNSGSTEPSDVETATEIVKHHQNAGRSKEFIMSTESYKKVISANPDFKL